MVEEYHKGICIIQGFLLVLIFIEKLLYLFANLFTAFNVKNKIKMEAKCFN
jgi:hypothetical protein